MIVPFPTYFAAPAELIALPSMKIVPLTVSVFEVAFQEISPLVFESSQ